VKIIQAKMIEIFKKWGVPKWIKVDNGRPFGDPQIKLIPPLALWLIGLGIKVIWNRPATPQDNAKVERSQGVMAKWTEYAKCKDIQILEDRLHREANFHNCHFPIRRNGAKTRQESHPSLFNTGTQWNSQRFDVSRVLNFLAGGRWERKVSKNGQINFYGQRFSIGTSFQRQKVTITLCPSSNQWQVYDSNENRITTIATQLNAHNIWNLQTV
jgi:hypothetical protein